MEHEEMLLKRLQRFEERALSEFYDAYSPGLYRYAWRLLGDEDLAEECVAETFSRLLKALEKGNGPRQHLKAYLYRVAHNWVTDHYRRGAEKELPLDSEAHIDPDPDPLDQVSESIEQAEVRCCAPPADARAATGDPAALSGRLAALRDRRGAGEAIRSG